MKFHKNSTSPAQEELFCYHRCMKALVNLKLLPKSKKKGQKSTEIDSRAESTKSTKNLKKPAKVGYNSRNRSKGPLRAFINPKLLTITIKLLILGRISCYESGCPKNCVLCVRPSQNFATKIKICEKCAESFSLTSGNTCERCGVSFCKICSKNLQNCQECSEGYHKVTVTKKDGSVVTECRPCLRNCGICQNGNTCVKCNSLMALNADKTRCSSDVQFMVILILVGVLLGVFISFGSLYLFRKIFGKSEESSLAEHGSQNQQHQGNLFATKKQGGGKMGKKKAKNLEKLNNTQIATERQILKTDTKVMDAEGPEDRKETKKGTITSFSISRNMPFPGRSSSRSKSTIARPEGIESLFKTVVKRSANKKMISLGIKSKPKAPFARNIFRGRGKTQPPIKWQLQGPTHLAPAPVVGFNIPSEKEVSQSSPKFVVDKPCSSPQFPGVAGSVQARGMKKKQYKISAGGSSQKEFPTHSLDLK